MVTEEDVDLAFKALSDPTRRSILLALKTEAQAVLTISQSFPNISRPAISKHLRILREAGLLAEEQVGRQRFYRFVGGSLDGAGLWLGSFREAEPPSGGREERVWKPRAQPGRAQQRDDWRVW
jgi:DNA-binding transcriptional ArsR family regulator